MKTPKKLLAKRTLRKPFVATVASTTFACATFACANTDGTGRDDPCPTSPPAGGAACPVDAQECGYDQDSCTGNDIIATCRNGQWSVGQMSCNPPPPPPPESCPMWAPETGGSCSEEGLVCEFADDDCNGAPTSKTAECRQGQWQISRISCNPPPVECPEQEPLADQACALEGQACNYGDCYGEPTVTTTCTDGTWDRMEMSCNPPPPECPTVVPEANTPCNLVPPSCEYGDCEGVPTITATCEEGSWLVVERSCNPPPPIE